MMLRDWNGFLETTRVRRLRDIKEASQDVRRKEMAYRDLQQTRTCRIESAMRMLSEIRDLMSEAVQRRRTGSKLKKMKCKEELNKWGLEVTT